MNYFLPISGIILRHLRLIKNNINRLLFVFYWPFLDLLLFGFMGKWIQTMQNNNNLEMVFLLSVLLWQTVCRTCMEVFVSFMEELWSYNIINIFASPIKLTEWLLGVIFFTIILISILIIYLLVLINIFYTISILDLLKNFIIFAPSLFLSGVSVGLLILSILIYFGMRANEIGFVICWGLMPLSGVFYPIETLPSWGQKISAWLPMSYIFTGMRGYITNQTSPNPYLIKGTILSLIYGIIFLFLFFYMFNKSKNKGLSRLSD